MSILLKDMETMESHAIAALRENMDIKAQILENQVPLILQMAEAITSCFENGGRLFLFGNGGSAADAQHLAAEFVVRFRRERPALPAIALTTDVSVLTAAGNDYGQEFIFSRQIEAFVSNADAVIAISTSGKSPNVIDGLRTARERGAICMGLTGSSGSDMCGYCDLCLMVPSNSTARIQEAHITIGHIVCDLVERRFAK